ncbi:hypothetical protein QA600_10950 [Natronococcus sp. A-GB1]|uniref:hypothetical protein n=1 Tax=Natronococcus sp. A-GB1 TaxID=3037648 RepID=UPI00241FEFB7|nr:hypothetical protein [Natronococcus sp. A-GB1]MDG5759858.1 hypothetical protein [Natronococcus sp. A-GB1]
MTPTDRSHVEFLGPPGAGKSAVHGRLTSDPRYYGGIYEDGLERLILDRYDGPARLAYRLLPSRPRSYVETLVLQHPIRKRLFSSFLLEQPSFPDAMVGARRAVSREPDQAASLLKNTAERYQLGVETVRSDERFCMDEGFAMGAVSTLWRGGDRFSLEAYFDRVPTPETLVYVTAPTAVCLRRQRSREKSLSERHGVARMDDAQERHEQACSRVAEVAEADDSITVVRAPNEGRLEDAVATVDRALRSDGSD